MMPLHLHVNQKSDYDIKENHQNKKHKIQFQIQKVTHLAMKDRLSIDVALQNVRPELDSQTVRHSNALIFHKDFFENLIFEEKISISIQRKYMKKYLAFKKISIKSGQQIECTITHSAKH